MKRESNKNSLAVRLGKIWLSRSWQWKKYIRKFINQVFKWFIYVNIDSI